MTTHPEQTVRPRWGRLVTMAVIAGLGGSAAVYGVVGASRNVGEPLCREALDLARREEFDLYVLDKHLPDGTGLELCRKLNELTPAVPCIFYSGDAYEIHRREALAAGADEYIAKPDLEALINTVHNVLKERECATAQT